MKSPISSIASVLLQKMLVPHWKTGGLPTSGETQYSATSGHQELLTIQAPPRFWLVSDGDGHFSRSASFELGIPLQTLCYGFVPDPAK